MEDKGLGEGTHEYVIKGSIKKMKKMYGVDEGGRRP